MTRKPIDWTNARVNQLKSLIEKDLSVDDIAEEMDLSRNAVSGKIRRLKKLQGSSEEPGSGFRKKNDLDIQGEAVRRGISASTLKDEIFRMGVELYRDEYPKGAL